jgi:hypothetical protein
MSARVLARSSPTLPKNAMRVKIARGRDKRLVLAWFRYVLTVQARLGRLPRANFRSTLRELSTHFQAQNEPCPRFLVHCSAMARRAVIGRAPSVTIMTPITDSPASGHVAVVST